MNNIKRFAIILLTSLAYAYRGGRLGQRGTFFGRLAWFAAIGVAINLATGNALYGLLAAIGAYLGQLIPHGHYFTMGRVEHPVNKKDWLGDIPDWLAMGIIGCMRGSLIWPPFFPLFGIAHAIAYELGWRIDRNDGVWISEYIFGFFTGCLILILTL